MDVDINLDDGGSLEDVKAACENNPECVGFAYWPASRYWYPKKRGTGFVPNSDVRYYQKRWPEVWEWYYLDRRAQEMQFDDPVDGKISAGNDRLVERMTVAE